jgi:proteasome beta subunit
MGRPLPVNSAARLLSNLLFSSRYIPLLAQVLVGGVDDTGAHVFSIDPFGSLTEERYVSTGSGSPVAYGILEDKYREGASVKDMLPVIVKAVNAAMKRDSASGDSFNVSVIDEKGYRDLTDKEKKQLLMD